MGGTYSKHQNLPTNLTETQHRSGRQGPLQVFRTQDIEELGRFLTLHTFGNGSLGHSQFCIHRLRRATTEKHKRGASPLNTTVLELPQRRLIADQGKESEEDWQCGLDRKWDHVLTTIGQSCGGPNDCSTHNAQR